MKVKKHSKLLSLLLAFAVLLSMMPRDFSAAAEELTIKMRPESQLMKPRTDKNPINIIFLGNSTLKSFCLIMLNIFIFEKSSLPKISRITPLPAFPQTSWGGSVSYKYPDTNMGGNWRTTDPKSKQKAMKKKNSSSNGLLYKIGRAHV